MTWIDDQPQDKIERALTQYRADSSIFVIDCKNDANGDDRYGLWLLLVTRALMRVVGLSYRDISDWTWADAYADGMSPSEAAREALAADGLDL